MHVVCVIRGDCRQKNERRSGNIYEGKNGGGGTKNEETHTHRVDKEIHKLESKREAAKSQNNEQPRHFQTS